MTLKQHRIPKPPPPFIVKCRDCNNIFRYDETIEFFGGRFCKICFGEVLKGINIDIFGGR